MLRSIIQFSVKNKLIVSIAILLLVIAGLYQLTRLPIDAVPDITDNQVQIITVAPSYGATDIERFVTIPVEQATRNIDGIKDMRSFSRFGLSLITIVFDEDVDIYWARQQVGEKLVKAKQEIPDYIGSPEIGPISSGLGEVYQYVLRPAEGYELKYNAMELRTLQDWMVRKQLLGVKGVAEVSSFGGYMKQYVVEIDPKQLASVGIGIDEVIRALETSNQNTGGSYIEKENTAVFIRTEGLVKTVEDIEMIAIKKMSNGASVYVKDIAKVSTGNATRYGAMCYNEEGEVAGAVVMMLKGGDSKQVIKEIKKKIEEIQKSLPEGVLIEPFLDRTKMIDNAIKTVRNNLLEGALIVVLVLVLFLGNWRAGLIVASVIPLSMLFAVILMNMFGVSGNLMSLGALDFGLIVDGAVIIVEAGLYYLHANPIIGKLSRSELSGETETIIIESSTKLMKSALFGQLIILIVYVPMLTLQGIEGKMFRPMAQTVSFALIGAFLLSISYVPMMSAWVLKKGADHKENKSEIIMANWSEWYKKVLEKTMSFPKLVISGILLLFLISLLIFSRLGGEFIPVLEEGDFAVDTRVLTGSNLKTTIEYTQKASALLLANFTEIEKIVTKIGSGEVPTDPMPMEASDMMVILKDKKQWENAKTFDELAVKMQEVLSDVPGITTGFQFPVQMRFNELMTGARQDIVCKIYGDDLDTLSKIASKIGEVASTIEGAKDIYVEPIVGMPQVIINYNYMLLSQYNVTVEELNSYINTLFSGKQTGYVYELERKYDLVVRARPEARMNVEDIKQMPIKTGYNTFVPLGAMADIKEYDGPNQIQREDARRRIIVGFNSRGRDVKSIVKELEDKISKHVKFPSGYNIRFGGSFENLQHATQRLAIAVPIALLLIFVLLYFAFGSVKIGLMIFTAIPLSAIGGVLLLAARGMDFSISAGIGFIALFGVAVLNGIVLIHEIIKSTEGGNTNMRQKIIDACGRRFRPVLMTAFVAALGFLPMAISTGSGAEVQKPLATVVIGGLFVSTILTLIVLPILFYLLKTNKRYSGAKRIVAVLLIWFSNTFEGYSQKYITFNEALQILSDSNLELKAMKEKAAYQKSMISTYKDIPPTEFATETGQVNSYTFDSKIGVIQSFKLPSVYESQKQILEKEFQSSQYYKELSWIDLKRKLGTLFNQFIYLNEKEKILYQFDSIYNDIQRRATLRLSKGESNVIEKMSVDNVRGDLKIQYSELQKDKEIVLLLLSNLLNSDTLLLPIYESVKLFDKQNNTVETFENHPELQLKHTDQDIILARYNNYKKELLPQGNIGYHLHSFREPRSLGGGYLASYAQASVQVPISRKHIKNKLAATKVLYQMEQTNYEKISKQMTSKYLILSKEIATHKKIIDYYEEESLENAKGIYYISNLQFYNGAITYLEWMILMSQSLQIELNYIDAIKKYNELTIDLIYFENE